MKETVFTLKKGTEVPVRFDGVTVPYNLPANNAEMLELAGDNAYIVFNRAYTLDIQKGVKVEAMKDGATVEALRAYPAKHQIGTRVRGPSTGTPRVKEQQVAQVLGEDFLSTLTPEQRALFDSKMATLKAATAKPAATEPAATEAPAAEAPPAPEPQAEAPRGNRKR